MSTMLIEFGAIILVRFPFTNQVEAKQRPAVVVSNRTYNAARPDLVIMAITSQVRATAGLGEVRIADWQAANLLKPSVIKPVFATIERGLVIRSLGNLQEPDQALLREAITASLG